MKKIAAFIPIKEHSERIPYKNFRMFNGRPLHFWVINSLLKCKSFDIIYIDTDSEKIINFYKNNRKIILLKRSRNLLGDNVNMNRIIKSDLSKIKEDYIFQTHVTNPLLKIKTIDDAIKTYFKVIKKNFDSVISVTELKKRFYTYRGIPINHNPKN